MVTLFRCLIFRDSKVEMYQKMWRYMESNTPNTFTHSYERGVEAVLNGSYAFLGESTMLHYLVQVHIDCSKFLLNEQTLHCQKITRSSLLDFPSFFSSVFVRFHLVVKHMI